MQCGVNAIPYTKPNHDKPTPNKQQSCIQPKHSQIKQINTAARHVHTDIDAPAHMRPVINVNGPATRYL